MIETHEHAGEFKLGGRCLPNITSFELHEGQYLVEGGRLEPYQPYEGHTGIDRIFEAVKGVGRGFDQMANAAIKQCVRMGWGIMEATSGENGTFFRRYVPSSDTPAPTLFPRSQSHVYVACRPWPPTSK